MGNYKPTSASGDHFDINGYVHKLETDETLIYLKHKTLVADTYETLESLGSDYQVPVGKKLLLFYVVNFPMASAVCKIGTSTVVNSNTGFVTIMDDTNGTFSSKIYVFTVTAGLFVTCVHYAINQTYEIYGVEQSA